ncbi:MAG TPA: hypothetical protein ENN33_13240 [Ignavibacteria bacterium]|nr:hypothetical protein [Ignavibacteria bacterium]
MKKPKFVIDQMCGRLAKWLRLMGYDAAYFRKIEDVELVNIARRENRVILTRDTGLIKRSPIANGSVKVLLVDSEKLDKQLKQLVKYFNLKCNNDLKRCVECNSELEKISKSEAKDKVPLYVYETQKILSRCTSCGRHYWRGTHWENIRSKFEEICYK